jgi:hypothetical protein
MLYNDKCTLFTCLPVDGVLSQWTEWGACDVTCGTGTSTRTRTCDGQDCGGNDCGDVALSETMSCDEGCCPGTYKNEQDSYFILDNNQTYVVQMCKITKEQGQVRYNFENM